jgi:hypothetical protein
VQARRFFCSQGLSLSHAHDQLEDLQRTCAARILDWVGDLPFLTAGLARRWLASWMLLKIVYLLMRWLFSLVALVFRGDRANLDVSRS